MSDKTEIIESLRRELAECEVIHGRNHVDFAKLAVKLAIYRRFDQLEGQTEAELLCRHAIEVYEREFGPAYLLLRSPYEILARIREQQNDEVEAESLYRKAVQLGPDEEGEDGSFSEDLLQSLGCLLHKQGRYIEAIEFLERALHVVERDNGSDYQYLGRHLHVLADTYVALKRYEDALNLYRRELDLEVRYNPGDVDERADLLERMAAVYALAEQFDRSEELLAEARPLRIQIDQRHETQSGQTLDTQYFAMENLLERANLLAARKDIEGAIDLVQQVLDYRIARPGTVLDCQTGLLRKLAKWNVQLERYDEAEALLQRSRAYLETKIVPLDELQRQFREKEASPEWRSGTRIKPFGSCYSESLGTVWNELGVVYHKQERREESLQAFQQATAIWKVTNEKQPGFVSTGLMSAATALHGMGEFDECCAAVEEALAWERDIREDSSYVASILVNYAAILESLNRHEEAVPLRISAVKLWTQNEGADQLRVIQCLSDTGQTLLKLNRPEEARPFVQQALGVVRESSQFPDRLLAGLLSNLSQIEIALRRSKIALPLMREAYALYQKEQVTKGPAIASLLHRLMDALLAAEQYEEAETYGLKWLAYLERNDEVDRQAFPCALANLAIAYHRQGQSAAALPLVERALPLIEEIEGPQAPNLATCLHLHAEILQHLCKHAAAKRSLARAREIEAKAKRRN